MSQDAEQPGLHCFICLAGSADDKWVAFSHCGHMMHAHCLDNFFASRRDAGKAPFCPKCRVRSVWPPDTPDKSVSPLTALQYSPAFCRLRRELR